MVVEEKDESVNEETETIDSAGEVVTSPTVETKTNDDKYVQLEQRITSLEQRFNGQEQQQQQQPQEDTSSNEQSDNDDSDNSDGMESDEEIKKILGL